MVISNKQIKIEPKSKELKSINILKTQLLNNITEINLQINELQSKKLELSDMVDENNFIIEQQEFELNKIYTDIDYAKGKFLELDCKLKSLPVDSLSEINNIKEKIQILNDIQSTLISSIEKYKIIETETSDKILNLNSELNTKENELNQKNTIINNIDADILNKTSVYKSLLQKNDNINTNIKNNTISYNELEAKHITLKKLLLTLEKQYNDRVLNLDNLERDIKNNALIIKSQKEICSELSKITNNSNNIKLCNEKLIEKNKQLKNSLTEITSLIDSSSVDKKNLDKLSLQIIEKQKELNVLETKTTSISNIIDEKNTVLSDISENILVKNKDLTKLSSLENKIQIAKLELKNIKEKTKTENDMLVAKKNEILKMILTNKKHLKSQEIAKFAKTIENELQ